VNRFWSAFLHPNLHFDSIFSQTLIPSMKLCWHQNRSRRITKKKIQKTTHFIIRLPDHQTKMWPNFWEKVPKCVFLLQKQRWNPKFKLFNIFLKTTKKFTIIENELIACSKNNTTKTNKKKNSVPDKNLEKDSVTKTVWTINWKTTNFNVEKTITQKWWSSK